MLLSYIYDFSRNRFGSESLPHLHHYGHPMKPSLPAPMKNWEGATLLQLDSPHVYTYMYKQRH